MLMSTTQPNRILAVEIRADRLGYAVFETPRLLQDYGGAWLDVPGAARSRIGRLLRLYRPSALVLRGGNMRYPRNMRSRKAISRIAKDEAAKAEVPVVWISEQEFTSFFKEYSCRNKYDIAAILATWFPDLAWRVPPQPGYGDPEPRSILYFDSIALGIVHLELHRRGALTPLQ
jgi:hypothetical protein